jgi:hypothetical protein
MNLAELPRGTVNFVMHQQDHGINMIFFKFSVNPNTYLVHTNDNGNKLET